MGAWIEIKCLLNSMTFTRVAPYMGAWIEISCLEDEIYMLMVAPYMGAWIEIIPVSAYTLGI